MSTHEGVHPGGAAPSASIRHEEPALALGGGGD
jgi:hypothetical protein